LARIAGLKNNLLNILITTSYTGHIEQMQGKSQEKRYEVAVSLAKKRRLKQAVLTGSGRPDLSSPVL
jgi:hypothetical protein